MGNTQNPQDVVQPITTTNNEPVEKEKPGEKQYKDGKNAIQKKDFNEALVYFQAAEEAGIIEAALEIGKLYRDGLGTQQNLENAVKYFKKVIDLGIGAGEAELGIIYYFGLGTI